MLSPDERKWLDDLKAYTLRQVRSDGQAIAHPLLSRALGIDVVNEAFKERQAIFEHLWRLIVTLEREAAASPESDTDAAFAQLLTMSEALATHVAALAASASVAADPQVRRTSRETAEAALAYVAELRGQHRPVPPVRTAPAPTSDPDVH